LSTVRCQRCVVNGALATVLAVGIMQTGEGMEKEQGYNDKEGIAKRRVDKVDTGRYR